MSKNRISKGPVLAGKGHLTTLSVASAATLGGASVGILAVTTAASLAELNAPALAMPGLALRSLKGSLGASAASGVETASGVTLPANSVMLLCFVDMATGA